MTLKSFKQGTDVRITGTVTDPNDNDALVDPDVFILTVTPPDGVTQTFTATAHTLARTGQGVYHADVLLDQAGDWKYVFVASGNIDAVGPGIIPVSTDY